MQQHLLPNDWLDHGPQELASLAPVQWIHWPAVEECGVKVALKREDLLHLQLGGNKVYKLYGYLRGARRTGSLPLLSFGGPWSNHLHALAAAGAHQGLKTIGIVRGEESSSPSAMLQDAAATGMHLHFVSRGAYREKDTAEFNSYLQSQFGNFVLIPEGGKGPEGLIGLAGLAATLGELAQQHHFDSVCCAVGTGSTLAGLTNSMTKNVTVEGFSALRAGDGLSREVAQRIRPSPPECAPWRLHNEFHGGGYAKVPKELVLFMQEFERQTQVPLDPVYTGKMMWGVEQLARAGYWRPGTRLLALHSGGLQGRRGFPKFFPALDEKQIS